MIHVLDLHFKYFDHAIAAFLIETSVGPVLVESGPHSTFNSLKHEVNSLGYNLEDIQKVLLTHIHFDHAGAAWALAEAGAKIYVHPFGAPHIQDPTKLYNSAKMIYGDEMATLWGTMNKIPGNQIVAPADGEGILIGNKKFTAIYSPGHAKHHIAWEMDDVIFTGDVAGVKIENGPVAPPCPPPDINLEDWNDSIDKLLESPASQLYLTHFGKVEDKSAHLNQLKEILNDWAYWVKEKWEAGKTAEEVTPEFQEYTASQLRKQGVSEHGVKQYEAANPSFMSVTGLIRYWKKKEGA